MSYQNVPKLSVNECIVNWEICPPWKSKNYVNTFFFQGIH